MATLMGKFITIYGVNGVGKSTQSKLLVDYLLKQKKKAEYLKYPIYSLSPSGLILNEYLRQKNKFNLSPREAQIIFTLNRTQYQSELQKRLNCGTIIVAEDYIQTGVAWGVANGISQKFLETINSHLIRENLSILLDGTPFSNSLNKNHLHEKNEFLIKKVRTTFVHLAKSNHWPIIAANQPIKLVYHQIIKIVEQVIS